MADTDTLRKLRLEAICSVCLEYFSDPAILDCGHNFCHSCLVKFWQKFVPNRSCPLCKTVTEPGSLPINLALENIAGLFKQLAKEALGREKMCDEHSKPLRTFCRNDKIPICDLCAQSAEHKAHNVVPAKEVAYEMKSRVPDFTELLVAREASIMRYKLKVELGSKDLLGMADKVEKDIEEWFPEVQKYLVSKKFFLMDKIRRTEKQIMEMRDELMTNIFWDYSINRSLIQEFEKKRHFSTLKLLQEIWGTLERCGQLTVYQAPDHFFNKHTWELWEFLDANTFLESTVKEFKETLYIGSALQKANVYLDPETAHSLLILSEDCKSVRVGERSQELSRNRKRFDTDLFVLGQEEFSENRNYWEVIVGPEEDWAVGVARKSLRRKGGSIITFKNGIWAIGKQRGDYVVFNPPDNPRLNHLNERVLKRVRVCLNCVGRTVTFFDADTEAVLYEAIIAGTAKRTYLPFFYLSKKAVLTLAF